MPLLMVILVPLLAAAAAAAAADTTVWHKALVSQDQLAGANTSQTFKVSEEILCAIHATHTPWCHLFTHNGGDCVLYDLLVDSLAPPPEDQDAVCYTRHRNVCITTDGEVLHNGEKREVEGLPQTCMDRVLVPPRNVSTCDKPFEESNVGCVHLIREAKTWDNASEHCASHKAKLAVVQAEKFKCLQRFLADNANDINDVWVGAKRRKWLDGRDVAENEWRSDNQPDDNLDACDRMGWDSTLHMHFLADKTCTTLYFFLCMRN